MNIQFNNRCRRWMASALLILGGCYVSSAQQQVLMQDTIGQSDVNQLYGKRTIHSVTSSISTVTGQEISKKSVFSFGNALFGCLPGLHVKQPTGEPGNDNPTFYIRGMHGSAGSSSPLILVDGLPRDFNTLSTDEVESVSVLKDAAATALYGMDGVNGIILVTTKRGYNGKVSVDFNAEVGLQQPTRLPEFYGSYNYASFYNMAERNDGKSLSSLTYSQAQLDGYKYELDNILYPNVNWIDECVREATPVQKYSVQVRGGNKVAQFYVNLGYTNSQGIYKEIGNKNYNANNNLDRFHFRSNLDVHINKRLLMTVDLAGRLENVNSPYNSSSDIWQNLYTYHPNTAPIYVAPGVYGGTNTFRNNPVAYINECGYRRTHRRLLQTNFKFEYDLSNLIQGMKVGVKAAFDNFYRVSNGYSKEFAVREAVAYDKETGEYFLSDSYGNNTALKEFGPSGEGETRSSAYEGYVKYDHLFGNHKVDAILLAHVDEKSTYLTAADIHGTPDKRINFAGQISYAYKDKYLFDVAASYGATGNFMRGKRFGLFPSAAFGWIASSEKFMKGVSFIDFLKLRASVGLVGNQNVGGDAFGYYTLYDSYGSGWNAGTTNAGTGNGYAEAAVANPYLTWEKSLKTDVGVDVTLWNSWNVMFNYFYEYRRDLLNSGSVLIPMYFGSTFGNVNNGKIASYGFEAALAYHKQYRNGGFNVGLTVAEVSNKVLRKAETTVRYEYLSSIGKPIGQRFGLICEGFYSEDDVKNRPVKQTFGAVIPGSLKYKDVNGDNVVDNDDKVAMGYSEDVPKWELGLNLSANYKGIYVNALFQACLGRDVNLRGAAPYVTSPLYNNRNISTWIKQPWTAEVAADQDLAHTIDFPSLTIENAANNYQNSTFFMKNGDFLRLRSLEIGYDLPKKWINKVRLQKASIYLRGMNLFTLDHIKDFDPEVLEGYPVMRSYNIGVNLTF